MPRGLRQTTALIVLAGMFGCQAPSPYVCPQTPWWQNLCVLEARYQNSDVLLLRAEVVYAYSFSDQGLREVSTDDWDRAAGRVVATRDSDAMSSSAANFQLDSRGHLFFRFFSKPDGKWMRRPIPDQTRPVITGKSAGDSVVMLACTRYRPNDMLFGGGERIRGPYYFRYFDPKSGSPLGPEVRLPFAEESGRVQFCVMEDARFIVFVDGTFSNVCIVPVESGAPEY